MWTLIYGYLITTLCITPSFSFNSKPDTNDNQLNHKQFIFNPIKLLIPSNVVDYNLLDPFLNNQLTNNNDIGEVEVGMEGGEDLGGQSQAYQLISHVDYGLFSKEDQESNSHGDFEPEGGGGNNQLTKTTKTKPETSVDYNQQKQYDHHSLSSIGKKRSSVMLNRLGFAIQKAAHMAQHKPPQKVDSPRNSQGGIMNTKWELISGDKVGGGKAFKDRSSGSKENLLVKCFFNTVSCF